MLLYVFCRYSCHKTLHKFSDFGIQNFFKCISLFTSISFLVFKAIKLHPVCGTIILPFQISNNLQQKLHKLTFVHGHSFPADKIFHKSFRIRGLYPHTSGRADKF